MNWLIRGVLAAATVASSLSASALVVEAQGTFTQPIWARIYAITPRCNANPDFPVVGRVAGFVGGSPRERLSWVGCFPSFAECEAWRRVARGEINPPIQQDRCERRR